MPVMNKSQLEESCSEVLKEGLTFSILSLSKEEAETYFEYLKDTDYIAVIKGPSMEFDIPRELKPKYSLRVTSKRELDKIAEGISLADGFIIEISKESSEFLKKEIASRMDLTNYDIKYEGHSLSFKKKPEAYQYA